jgi:hypothetical protein
VPIGHDQEPIAGLDVPAVVGAAQLPRESVVRLDGYGGYLAVVTVERQPQRLEVVDALDPGD